MMTATDDFIIPPARYVGEPHNLFAAAMFESCDKNIRNSYIVYRFNNGGCERVIRILHTYVKDARFKLTSDGLLTIGLSDVGNATFVFYHDIIENAIHNEIDKEIMIELGKAIAEEMAMQEHNNEQNT